MAIKHFLWPSYDRPTLTWRESRFGCFIALCHAFFIGLNAVSVWYGSQRSNTGILPYEMDKQRHIAETDSCGSPCQSRPGWAGHTCWSSEDWCRRCRPSSDAAAHTRCQPSWPPVRLGARWWWRCPETQWWWFWREPGWDREGNRERLAHRMEAVAIS